MPELRKDPIIGRWVIVATERAKRPDQLIGQIKENFIEDDCPFCAGKEHLTPPEIFALRDLNTQPNSPGWKVRVVPNVAPYLRIEGELERRGRGIYDIMNGVGAHEVVIETNEHISNIADLSEEQIVNVFNCYVNRIVDLEKDKRFKYVLIFKNYGWAAGSSKIRHSRSQIIATPVNPKRVKEELVGAKHYYEYHERCVFCDLIRQEVEAKDRVILDIDDFVAIVPFAARFPFEIWIIPKKHSCDFISLEDAHRRSLAKILKLIHQKLKVGLNDPPYNSIIHTAPFRREKSGFGKTIEFDYHWHIEITPRLTRVAGFEWGTGFYICPVTPEAAAKFLREVHI